MKGDFRVENCCCFSLETGVIILGVFDLVVGILTAGNGARFVGNDPLVGSDYIIEGLVVAICGLCLILGVRKSDPRFFIPSLIVAGIGLIRYAISFVLDIRNGIKHHVEISHMLGNLLADLLVVCLAIYFWIVIHSLFRSLKEGSSNRKNSGVV